jgi:DNA-binding MarR family transcriptional regulator
MRTAEGISHRCGGTVEGQGCGRPETGKGEAALVEAKGMAERDGESPSADSPKTPLESPAHPPVRGIASLIEQLARYVNSLCWTEDMQPAQWSALRYFALAGTRARTVMGLATFQGTNPATASRTIAVLTRRGLLDSVPVADDRRSRTINLTESGRDLLARDPLLRVEEAVGTMPTALQARFGADIQGLLAALMALENKS